jgi:hypothetical protein
MKQYFSATHPSEPNYHLKVTNLSPGREITITHIWFELEDGQQLHHLNLERPLPSRLRLGEPYEMWLPVAQVSGILDWAGRFRVKLSGGEVIMSRLNKSVPAVGYVAGGGESPYSAPMGATEPAGVTGIDPEKIKGMEMAIRHQCFSNLRAPQARQRGRTLGHTPAQSHLPPLALSRPPHRPTSASSARASSSRHP